MHWHLECAIAAAYFFLSYLFKKNIRFVCENHADPKNCENSFHTIVGLTDAAWVLCSLISIMLLPHFMKCHRDHVFQLYRGERGFYQGVVLSPRDLVGQSLCFSGYQIAYTIIGIVTLFAPFLYISIISGLIVSLNLTQQTSAFLKQKTLEALPTAGFAAVMWLFQRFLDSFVFSDRDSPNVTITVANRQLFSIASYFFFFFNIITGFFSGVFRLLKALLLGMFFMSRIDRTCLMQGYESWDPAFLTYVGFVNVLVAHSHPVMLVFCHLLINRNSDRGLEESLLQIESSGSSREQSYREGIVRMRRVARLSQKAVNRWLLAVMLLRNPSLLKNRRQGGVTRFVDMSSASINSDVGIVA